MTPFKIIDVPDIETTPAAAGEREAKILAMIASSTITCARVQFLDLDTGRYHIVLEGLLRSDEGLSVPRLPSGALAAIADDDDSDAETETSPFDDRENDDVNAVPNVVVEPSVEEGDRAAGSLGGSPIAEPPPLGI